jgi:hypothetical protein
MPQPDVHVPALHTMALPQIEPSAIVDQLVVDLAGWQLWHELLGLSAALVYKLPPIKHMAWQEPVLQTLPVPQLVPLLTGVQPVLEVVGWHERHALLGLTVPLVYVIDAMLQVVGALDEPPVAATPPVGAPPVGEPPAAFTPPVGAPPTVDAPPVSLLPPVPVVPPAAVEEPPTVDAPPVLDEVTDFVPPVCTPPPTDPMVVVPPTPAFPPVTVPATPVPPVDVDAPPTAAVPPSDVESLLPPPVAEVAPPWLGEPPEVRVVVLDVLVPLPPVPFAVPPPVLGSVEVVPPALLLVIEVLEQPSVTSAVSTSCEEYLSFMDENLLLGLG